jgi:AcrR family transcriptional regulator
MITQMKRKKRRYTLRRRAEQQAQTRSRIVDAAMALHEELGPKATTISAIAERAGVERLTVYRHFPDDNSLFRACSSRFLELNPPPEPASRETTTDSVARVRAALLAVYRYYRRTESMWTRVYHDLEEVEALKRVMNDFDKYLARVRDDLMGALNPAPAKRRELKAVLAHCLLFFTWQSLKRQSLSDAAMADLVVQWLVALNPPAQETGLTLRRA